MPKKHAEQPSGPQSDFLSVLKRMLSTPPPKKKPKAAKKKQKPA